MSSPEQPPHVGLAELLAVTQMRTARLLPAAAACAPNRLLNVNEIGVGTAGHDVIAYAARPSRTLSLPPSRFNGSRIPCTGVSRYTPTQRVTFAASPCRVLV